MTRMKSVIRFAGVAVLLVLLSATFLSSVSAHESREVGDYEFTVGFVNEPAYVEEMNGVQLSISRTGEDDEPVLNAHESLQVAINYGEETREVELRPVFGEDGEYTADVIPTETGSYSFQFVGDIEGQEIDETFSGGPDTFSEVEPRDELEFPAGGAETTSDNDQIAAFGIAGVVAGMLGLIAGAAGYYKASNSSPQQRQTTRQRQRQQETE